MSSSSGPPPPSVLSPPPPPGVTGNKKLVWIIVAVVFSVLLLAVLFVGAVGAAIFAGLRSSDPYRFAMQTAARDPRVVARLGSPVQAGWLVGGNIDLRNDSGEADLSIPVSGPIHKGTIHVVGTKTGGEWTYQKLTLRVEDGPEGINLLKPPGALLEEK
jgi:Cytochrome oxidase complex assembly protein 1